MILYMHNFKSMNKFKIEGVELNMKLVFYGAGNMAQALLLELLIPTI